MRRPKEVPLFIISGFLESGKTTFIQVTLSDPEFTDGDKILIFLCEEGEVELDADELKKKNVEIVAIDSPEELNAQKLEECNQIYRPDKIVVEMNGMWQLDVLEELEMPAGWFTAQIITIVDASTFMTYLSNMRKIMMEQLKFSDTIIFNRCNPEIKKMDLRRSVKLVNRKAQLLFEAQDGVDTGTEEDEMPFDLNAPVIEIEEEDFGLWYMDMMDFPKRYEGKTVSFKGMVAKGKDMPPDTFVPGRFAMTCCAEDVAFIGFFCRADIKYVKKMRERTWVQVTASVKTQLNKADNQVIPVLYAKSIEGASKPLEEIVYFS